MDLGFLLVDQAETPTVNAREQYDPQSTLFRVSTPWPLQNTLGHICMNQVTNLLLITGDMKAAYATLSHIDLIQQSRARLHSMNYGNRRDA